DDRFRKQGLATRLMDHAIETMRERGAQVSLLYGIDNFYHRWGYASCGDEHSLRLLLPEPASPSSRGRLPVGWNLREATPADQPQLQAIYELSAATVAGSNLGASRARAWNWLGTSLECGSPARRDGWPNGPATGSPECTVLTDDHGEIAGYLWLATGSYSVDELARRNPDDAVVGELHARDDEAAAAMVVVAHTLGRRWGLARGAPFAAVHTGTRPGHNIADAALGSHHCEIRRELRPHGGLMALVLADNVEAPADWYQFLPDRF
ncbi:MAG: GNAT family N-acetyltransferase, partial [Thermoleophilia bacterium]|nr:GNAT family N-acetyltransferase [Thermoleophilia bacterium]